MTITTMVTLVMTIRLFTKYDASGTVDHMSMNGWMVRFCGHQVKAPCTSGSVFSDDVIIT